MADTVISLASQDGNVFLFGGTEVPESISFGGAQKVVVHELVGGKRVADAMGRADKPLAWHGLMRGTAALERARYLDYLRVAGLPLVLTWHEMQYSVILESFEADFQRFYQIPYHVSFLVVDDLARPVTAVVALTIDDELNQDIGAVKKHADKIGDADLSAKVSALDKAIKAVSTFANATQAVIKSVTTPLAAVMSKVTTLTAQIGNTAQNVTTFGGLLPGNSLSQAAARISSQTASMGKLSSLYSLQSTTRRMGKNLGL